MARAGVIEPATPADMATTSLLEATLRLGSADAGGTTASGSGKLTPEQMAMVQSFASAELLPRDARADAQADADALTRMSAMPIFIARTQSGGAVPVFGGMTIDEFDEIPPELKRSFVQATQKDLRDLGQLLLTFGRQPGEAATLTRMGEIAHTIKGSAATMGFPGFTSLARLFEEVIMSAQRRRESAGADDADDGALVAGLARFLELFERAMEAAQSLDDLDASLLDDAHLLHRSLLPSAAVAPEPRPHSADHASADAPLRERGERDHNLSLHVEAQKLDVLMNELSALAAHRGALARNRGEIAKAQGDMLDALVRLREKGAQISDSYPLALEGPPSGALRAGVSHPLTAPLTSPGASGVTAPIAAATSSGALRASWSSLQYEQHSEMDAALRALTEVVADVNANYHALSTLLGLHNHLTEAQEAISRDIQTQVMSIRLARLDEIIPRLRVSAMVAAEDMGKLVELDIQGESVEIDRSLREKLEEPLVQLLRNAIAHGVESPRERVEAGKSPRGRIWIHAYNAGASVVIEVGDDGCGVNVESLVKVAQERNLIPVTGQHALTPQQALHLMFLPGVTTGSPDASTHAAALAGSGIGLSEVDNAVRDIKGSISVRNEPGMGTVFQIRAPISLSVQPVLETHAVGQVFALPFELVEHTAMLTPERLRPAATSASAESGLREWRLTVDLPVQPEDSLAQARGTPDETATREIAAYALAETLGFVQNPETLTRAVVIRMRDTLVALLVEAVGESDVRDAAVRPLPRPLQRRAVRGVVVRPEDGQVALLIDPQEALAQRLMGEEINLRPAAPTALALPEPWVLIVDDSATIRRTLEQALTQAGFKASVARDGYEALELMAHERPRVVILDVEMPRLNGLDLLSIMRSSPQYEGVRVAILTSRGADRQREQALALGADTYLVKPVPQETLVEIIRRLLSEPETEPA